MKARLVIAVAAGLLIPSLAHAAEIKLLASTAIKDAYLELIPPFEKATGHKVTAAWSSTPDIQKRIAGGEAADLVILGNSGTEELIKQGKLVAGSRADFAKSGIGVAVRAGAPKPDISSADAVKKSLLAAKSVAYSAGASGIYLVSMFQKLGISDQVKSKTGKTRRTGRRGGRARRCRDRLPAGERAHSREGHPISWTAAGRDPKHHGIFRRHP